MRAFRPRTTKTGGLPHLSFILRKPEPLGTEFKVICCGVTGIMLHLEIQRGNYAMKKLAHFRQLGAMSACTKRLVDGTANCGRAGLNDSQGIESSFVYGQVVTWIQ